MSTVDHRSFFKRSSSFSRRSLLAASGVAALAAITGGSAIAADFPQRPIRMVVPFTPGGATDTVARLFAQEMGTLLGQSIVIENRGGGGSLAGTELVKKSPPDGYTILFGTTSFAITPLLGEATPYDAVRDFEPIGLVTMQSLGVFVHPSINVSTIAELVAYGKRNPGTLNFASTGVGSGQHLAGEEFARKARLDIQQVQYKGTAPAMQDLLGGRVQVMFASLIGSVQYVQDGRLRLIGVTGSSRIKAVPQVPTIAEAGQVLAGYEALSWQALLAPKGTPAAVISKINAALLKAGQSPRIRENLSAQGMEVQTSSPTELRSLLERDTTRYKTLLKTSQ